MQEEAKITITGNFDESQDTSTFKVEMKGTLQQMVAAVAVSLVGNKQFAQIIGQAANLLNDPAKIDAIKAKTVVRSKSNIKKIGATASLWADVTSFLGEFINEESHVDFDFHLKESDSDYILVGIEKDNKDIADFYFSRKNNGEICIKYDDNYFPLKQWAFWYLLFLKTYN